MNKFLKLVEETDPANNNSVYVISIKGPGGPLKDIQINGGDEHAWHLHDQIGKWVKGEVDFTPVEDQEEELTADAAIENAAENDPDSPAGKAVEDRKRKVDQLVAQYVGDTSKIS
jgi:hypothetical protein